jgi:HEAT repeat protein
LGRIGPEARAAVPALIESLTDDAVVDPAAGYSIRDDRDFVGGTVAAYTATALAQIGPGAVPGLIEALRSKNANVRRIAAKVLGKIGPAARQAVPWLRPLLKDEQGGVREAAAQALKQIDPAEATAADGR